MKKAVPKRSNPVERPPRWKTNLAAFERSRLAFLGAPGLLLIPCYWQSRLQAGDLSSHLYNAWLSELAAEGRVPGVTVQFQTTNVLFDLLLSALLRVFGAGAAQRLAVSLAVLVFAWGAFAFVSKVAGRRSWSLLLPVAVFTYGWVFHMGFFNYFLSLGLCFGALALAWEPSRVRLTWAAAILVVAYVAHPLPVAWAICIIAYTRLAQRYPSKSLLFWALGAIAAAAFLIRLTLEARWSPDQATMITGFDQARVFGSEYWFVYIGLLLVWAWLMLGAMRRSSVRTVLASVPSQLCILGAAAVLIFPDWLMTPVYKHALAFIAERMSLPLAICMLALAGTAPVRASQTVAIAALAMLFFVLLYRDESALNAFEDTMQTAVSQLPPGQRVISGIDDPFDRVDAVQHIIDRVCVGRCYSYANYEPSTRQFRVRVVGDSPIVISRYDDSWQLQNGLYVVQPKDLPLYQVVLEGSGHMFIRSLPAGSACGMTYWNGLSTRMTTY
ncbi:MAG: hypothetical protein ABSH09_04605 [Bryobacteraceae bacterium]